jgi:hypothetical protein
MSSTWHSTIYPVTPSPQNSITHQTGFIITSTLAVYNSIVHSITKETITKYTKFMNDPALKDLWVLAMSKELHRMAQQKAGVRVGNNTIFYLTHAEIRRILKDHTVTYARIVINHCPQKDNPNQVQITVGGNLIDYPY